MGRVEKLGLRIAPRQRLGLGIEPSDDRRPDALAHLCVGNAVRVPHSIFPVECRTHVVATDNAVLAKHKPMRGTGYDGRRQLGSSHKKAAIALTRDSAPAKRAHARRSRRAATRRSAEGISSAASIIP